MTDDIRFYTDGSGQGKIGWAWVCVVNGQAVASGQGYSAKGTNNIAELSAVISALHYIKKKYKKKRVTIISDSQYIVRAVNLNWIEGWKKRDWKRASGELANKRFWQIMDAALADVKTEFKWVKGHNGNTWNEVADQLAEEAKTNGVNKIGKYTNQIG